MQLTTIDAQLFCVTIDATRPSWYTRG